MNQPVQSSKSNPLNESTITIVGVGLIGGSIALALKSRGFTGTIIGLGRNQQRLDSAKAAGLIDVATTDEQQAFENASLGIFCTPVEYIVNQVQSAAKFCPTGALLTDAGSTKQVICEALDGDLPNSVEFIGSHPLAGSEQQGFEHATENLYQDRVCVLTPSTPSDNVARLRTFWEFIGMQVVELPADEHDHILARTSHLPHVVASALASVLDESDHQFAATGFRDTTRIAGGDPSLWISILLTNSTAICSGIDQMEAQLREFRTALTKGDAESLKKLLQTAKTKREQLS